jgi:hypothetical protein
MRPCLLLSRARYPVAGVLLAALLYWLSPPPQSYFVNSDQGAALAVAQEISMGLHPIADIDSGSYGPLTYYSTALALWLSGQRLIGIVVLNVLGYGLAYVVLFWLTRELARDWMVACVVTFAGFLLIPRFHKFYIMLGPLIVSWACLRLSRQRVPSWRDVLILAATTTACGLFRWDFGFHAAVASFLLICLVFWPRGPRQVSYQLGVYVVGGVLMSLPLVAFLAFEGLSLAHAVTFIRESAVAVQGLSLPLPTVGGKNRPFGPADRFGVLFWLFAMLPWVSLILLYVRRRRLAVPDRHILIALSVLSILVFSQAMHRPAPSHLLQVLPIQWVLIAAWAPRLLTGMRSRLAAGVLVCSVLLVAAPFVFAELKVDFKNSEERAALLMTREQLRRHALSWSASPRVEDSVRATDWLARHTGVDEAVLILPWAPQLYYLSERGFRTRRGWITPGLMATENAQRLFFQSLLASKTRWVVELEYVRFDARRDRELRHYVPHLMQLIDQYYCVTHRINSIVFRHYEPGGCDPAP